jgi:hypothetical protein
VQVILLQMESAIMLDKRKGRTDTCGDTPNSSKESRMPAAAKAKRVAAESESEVESAAKSISSNEEIGERIKLAILQARQGKVVTRQKAIQRLKKRAS